MINCQFENGSKANLRHVTVKSLTLDSSGQMLIIRRAFGMWNGGKYDIPGGFMERDENAEQTAIRELFEETGLHGKVKYLFRVNDDPKRPKEDRQNVEFIYVVEVNEKQTKENDEVAEFVWVDEKNLPPDEDFAFDHHDSIVMFFSHLKEARQLPIIG